MPSSRGPGFEAWCQGGPANDWRIWMLPEPPDQIEMLADPFHPGQFIRVIGPWPEATTYVRVRDVEQIDGECIYYPADAVT